MSSSIENIERELGVLIRRAQARPIRVHPDLDASAYSLLLHIVSNPRIRPSDLAKHFGIGRATTSRQLTRLVDLGLVERMIDPADSRSQELDLTDAGRTRLHQARTKRLQWYATTLEDWSESDLNEFAAQLARLTSAMNARPAATGLPEEPQSGT